jgi:hypothetical protein
MMINRNIILKSIWIGLLSTVPLLSMAQSAISEVISFSMDDVSELYMPPELFVDIDFVDANENKILEAFEKGTIIIKISNVGGDANNVSVSVKPLGDNIGFEFEKNEAKTNIKTDETVSVEFPINANIDLPNDSVRFQVKVAEPMGYDIEASLVLSTFEYQRARIGMQGVSIIDAGRGLRALNNNPDGKVQKGEVVRATVSLQNIGIGDAEDLKYRIVSRDPNVILMSESGTAKEITGNIDRMLSGESREVSFRLSANNNYNLTDEFLPVYISVVEKENKGNLDFVNIPIPLGKTPEKPTIVDIKGEREKLIAAQQMKVYSSSDRITASSRIRDISVAPAGEPIYRNAVAVVIGAEKNSYGVASAPYAARDAKIMANFFKNSMGIEDIQLKTDSEVTSSLLSDMFDPRFGHLAQVVEPGKTDVFVFYSGHGMPDIAADGSQDIFLFPYDARKEMVRDRGYSLTKLYSDLNSLNARSVTVILDACFSGSSRQTASYKSENISNAKGIRISMPEMSNRPWDTNPNFRLFTSSSEDQTSLGFDQSQSGLFTYFIAIGLQGEADENNDGVIKFDELVSYVTKNVSGEALKIRGGAQTPQFYGDGNFVIERIK